MFLHAEKIAWDVSYFFFQVRFVFIRPCPKPFASSLRGYLGNGESLDFFLGFPLPGRLVVSG